MGSKSAPAPQPVVNVPSPPTYGQQLSDYISNYPQLFNLEKQYSPQEAQLQLDILKQYGPEYSAEYQRQLQELYPVTSGLQEQLATLASQNMGASLPDSLKSQYQDQLRAELGSNVGSGIGSDYVSRNLINLGEDYKKYYQNLGLSLLGNQPLAQPTSQVPYNSPASGLSGALGYGANTYGSYTQALVNQPFYFPAPKSSSGTASLIGGGIGAVAGSFLAPGAGTMAGYGIGSSIGGMF